MSFDLEKSNVLILASPQALFQTSSVMVITLSGIGALALGVVASFNGVIEQAFWFVAIAMLLSGLVVQIWGEETHPRLNPAFPS